MACAMIHTRQLFQVAKVSVVHMSDSSQSICSSRTISKLHPHLRKQNSRGKHLKAVHYEVTVYNFKAGYICRSPRKFPSFYF
jgi:hypothetical protein